MIFGVIGLTPPGLVCIGTSGFYKMACVFFLFCFVFFRLPLEWNERLVVNPPSLSPEVSMCRFFQGEGKESKGLDYSAGRK